MSETRGNQQRGSQGRHHMTEFGTSLACLFAAGFFIFCGWLKGANLRGARLLETNLEGAYLDGANLTRAGLDKANLTGADLTESNLEEAFLYGTILDRANLKVPRMLLGR